MIGLESIPYAVAKTVQQTRKSYGENFCITVFESESTGEEAVGKSCIF